MPYPNSPYETITEMAERDRISMIFETALKHNTVLLVAGAGTGKTTALSTALKRLQLPSGQINLSPADNYISQFWDHFCSALKTACPTITAQLDQMSFPELVSEREAFFTSLNLAVSPTQRLVLVFDQFQYLEDNAVKLFIEKLVQADTPLIHLVLVSRQPIRLDLKDLKITSIGEAHLRLTHLETTQYLSRMGVQLTKEISTRLYEITEGWALANHLFARHLPKEQPLTPDHVDNAYTQIFRVLDVLCFSVYPKELQNALILLGLLKKFTPELAVSVLNVPAEQLHELFADCPLFFWSYSQNCFVFYHLFTDLMQYKAIFLSEVEVSGFFSRSGSWYQQHDSLLDAGHCFLQAKDYDTMHALLYQLELAALKLPQLKKYQALLAQVPEDALYHTPQLGLLKAWFSIRLGQFPEGFALLSSLCHHLSAPELTPEARNTLGEAYALLAVGTLRTSGQSSKELFSLADAYLPQGSRFIGTKETPYTGILYQCLFHEDRLGDMKMRHAALLNNLSNLTSPSLINFGPAWAQLEMGACLYFSHDLKEAKKYAQCSAELARKSGYWDLACYSHFLLMRIGIARGSYREANANIKTIQLIVDQYDQTVNLYPIADLADYIYYMALGDYQTASMLASPLAELDRRDQSDWHHLVSAIEKFCHGHYTQLLIETASSIPQCRSSGQHCIMLCLMITEALAFYKSGNTAAAICRFEQCYTLAAADELIMPFVEFGSLIRGLLATVKRQGSSKIPEAWLDMLYRRVSTHDKYLHNLAKAHALAQHEAPTPLKGVTAKEREILKLVCAGLSNAEIASAMNLTLNTVKGTLSRIYRKIDAVNRADAVRIAIHHIYRDGLDQAD